MRTWTKGGRNAGKMSQPTSAIGAVVTGKEKRRGRSSGIHSVLQGEKKPRSSKGRALLNMKCRKGGGVFLKKKRKKKVW